MTRSSSTSEVNAFDSINFEDIDVEDVDLAIDTTTTQSINEIRFHAVMVEEHSAQTQITKFPVQNGFEISNHAIKKNRKVTIEGIFTNTLLKDTDQIKYSENDSKTMFEVLESLVQASAICEVITNLGIYTPVVFTTFKTKQEAGMVDAMRFTISGEEIQVSEVTSKTAPKQLVFTEVPPEARQSYIDKLTSAGIAVDEGISLITDDTILSTAEVFLGEDFSMESVLPSGELYDVTLVNTACDGKSGFTYDVFTSNTNVFTELGDVAGGLLGDLNIPLIPSVTDLVGGFNGVTNCLLNGSSNVLVKEAEKYIDTAMGVLDKSIYGAKQDIIRLGTNDAMQSLIGTGLDCVAASASDVLGAGEASSVDEAVDELIVGIKSVGNVITASTAGVVSNVSNNVLELVKIESPTILPLQNLGQENY